MTSILLVIQIVLVLLLTIAVLLQKSSSIGLGAYSGSNESVFGAKGPGSFLAKATFFLGFLFVSNTIALGYFYGQLRSHSVVDAIEVPDVADAPQMMPTAPSAIPAPVSNVNTTTVETTSVPIPLPGTAPHSAVEIDVPAPLPRPIVADSAEPAPKRPTSDASTSQPYLYNDN